MTGKEKTAKRAMSAAAVRMTNDLANQAQNTQPPRDLWREADRQIPTRSQAMMTRPATLGARTTATYWPAVRSLWSVTKLETFTRVRAAKLEAIPLTQ